MASLHIIILPATVQLLHSFLLPLTSTFPLAGTMPCEGLIAKQGPRPEVWKAKLAGVSP